MSITLFVSLELSLRPKLFVPNPIANTATQAAGAIYPVGSVAGVQVYTNPKQSWSDLTVSVGRKGDGNGIGSEHGIGMENGNGKESVNVLVVLVAVLVI